MPDSLNKTATQNQSIEMSGGLARSFSPGYLTPTMNGNQIVSIDDSNNLMTRGPVHTDEGSFRDNFSGTTIGISVGTANFTNGSNVVTGNGFASQDIHKQDYIKLTSDPDSRYTQVYYLSDTEIVLYGPYQGVTTVNGAMTCAISVPVTGAGGTVTASTGQGSIASGTTTGSQSGIFRNVDYGPLVYQEKFSVSQRIVNNDLYAGLNDASTTDPTVGRWFARFHFTSTTNTTVLTETGFNRTTTPSGNEIESNTITLPNSLTTATSNVYRVEQLLDSVLFYINGTLVATHTQSIPRPMDALLCHTMSVNTGVPASTTTTLIDYSTVKDFNRIDVGFGSINENNGSVTRTALPTPFGSGQVALGTGTTSGQVVVRPYSIPELEWQYSAAASGISNTVTAVTIKATAGAGVRNYITGIQLNAEALGAATEIAVRDGAAGTVIWREKIGTAGLTSGSNIVFTTPLKGTANTLLEVVTLTASVTGAVYFNAQGYQAY